MTDSDSSVIQIAADVGGTFTDVVVSLPGGSILTRKVPSTPPNFEVGVLIAVDEVLAACAFDRSEIATVCHGTTVATNAVLERRGAKTALITTRGFRDVLELRRIRAPQLYDLFFQKPPAIVDRYLRFELTERISAGGEVLVPVNRDELEGIVERLVEQNIESIAVCFLHSYIMPDHEREVGEYLHRVLPDLPISLSYEVVRQRREYERTATTAVNAYIQLIMRRYLDRLQGGLRERGIQAPLMIMQSAGGLTPAADAALRPVFALESGPAAGVLAAGKVAKATGTRNVISFDMGGTTAKAAMIENGDIPYSPEYEVGSSLSAGNRLTGGGGELILAPSIDIAEVGAGGGSMAYIDAGGGLRVGPRSAGAIPGPACYQRGGTEPTVTDANVVLGYIKPGQLAGGDVVIDEVVARRCIEDKIARPLGMTVLQAALGIHRIANAEMLRALREVSTHRGRDPREFALVAFGGSGPIHAAHLADELGTNRVIVPPVPGVFSAVGLLASGLEHHDVRSCRLADETLNPSEISSRIQEMHATMLKQLILESAHEERLKFEAFADLRFVGEISDIRIRIEDQVITTASIAELRRGYEEEHERMYGHRSESGAPIEITAIRLIGREARKEMLTMTLPESAGEVSGSRVATFPDSAGPMEVQVTSRGALTAETEGPLLVDEYDATIVIPPGWSAHLDEAFNIIMEKKHGNC
ncbi:MAG: hydantoinase/oxoprolinase family protein [Planctomycetota bacterium]|nr:hydantoinase/oxoprolinase family protein [Planctomycetota bacterium]MDA1139377.1 hydantoinase/oxoprolinase family protein [Planctomycetota bacterium]